MENFKKCKKCEQNKNVYEFHTTKSNYQSICKGCKAEYDKTRSIEKNDELKIKSKIYRSNLTKEQKNKINKAKKHVFVNCHVCNLELNKRKDSLKSWSGMCTYCSRKEISSRPEMKEHYKQNGLNFIEKYGKIPSPAIENRPRGDKHHNWGVSRKGKDSFNWRGGITPENERIRHSKEYKEWRLHVFERDNFACVNCGDNKGGNLNADHIQPFSLFPELRLDINNGRTLCIDCHKEIGWSPSKNKLQGTAWVSH
jgi:hypothetical protein